MLQQDLSDELWAMLKERAHYGHEYDFSTRAQVIRVDVQTFSVWVRLKNGHREKRRDYYRMLRAKTGTVLYDQLEDVSPKFVSAMKMDRLLIPDVRISTERANKLLSAALEQQTEVDRLISESAGRGE